MGKIKVNEYILKNPKIKANKTILCMSDIHGNIKALENILELIKDFKFDYILIPGDTVDTLTQDKQEEFLDKVIELSKYAKTYIALGNHDILLKRANKSMIEKEEYDKYLFFNKLKSIDNLKLFINDYDSIKLDDNINLSILNLDNNYYKSYEKRSIFNEFINNLKVNEIDNDKFNILLVHTPNCLIKKKKIVINKITENQDLILCGHNHGGLTPTWAQDLFKNHIGIVGPYNGIIESLAYGIWTNDNKSLLLSNGVTKMSEGAILKPIHGIGNALLVPEIELIHLENNEKHSVKLIKRTNYKI